MTGSVELEKKEKRQKTLWGQFGGDGAHAGVTLGERLRIISECCRNE